MKTDKSTKVGGRRNKGKPAKKGSMAKGPRGKAVVYPGGSKAYHNK